MPVELIFEEPLEAVRERVAKRVGKCSVSHDLSSIHPAIQRLLTKDEARREDYNRWLSDTMRPISTPRSSAPARSEQHHACFGTAWCQSRQRRAERP
jgi:hypothetical protein